MQKPHGVNKTKPKLPRWAIPYFDEKTGMDLGPPRVEQHTIRCWWIRRRDNGVKSVYLVLYTDGFYDLHFYDARAGAMGKLKHETVENMIAAIIVWDLTGESTSNET